MKTIVFYIATLTRGGADRDKTGLLAELKALAASLGDVGARVMRERQHLGQDGIIIISASVDGASGELLAGPDVYSKGFVYVKEAEFLMKEAVTLSMSVIDSFPPYSFDINSMSNKLRDEISRLMYERTKRSPMILPIIMEV